MKLFFRITVLWLEMPVKGKKEKLCPERHFEKYLNI